MLRLKFHQSQSSTFSEEVAALLGISIEDTNPEFKHIFRKELPHSRPYSMSYAGHQFGNCRSIRDGRAIILLQK
jgi:uncharacterized protein YdiU (UPF0061 family)